MIYTVKNEQPIQILTDAFSISPSSEGYVLQISSDGYNYSDLFSVGPNVTRLVTNVAAGSYYRLKGNASEVDINWIKNCGGGSGSGAQGPQGPAGSGSGGTGTQGPQGPEGVQGPAGGGEGGDSHILLASSGTPEGLQDGDVWAFHGIEQVPVDKYRAFSSVTMTFVEGQGIIFHLWVEPWGGWVDTTAGVTDGGDITGPWGVEDNVITGPWGNGIEVTFNGDEITFTTQNPDADSSMWMCDFNPPITEPAEGWHTYQSVSGINKEFALKEDLPAEGTLLPISADDNTTIIYASNAWRTQSRGAFTYDGLLAATTYDSSKGAEQALIRTSQYGWGWEALDKTHIEAVSALPATAKDGSVYAYANASAHSIVQAQGTHSGYTWENLSDKTIPSGVITKIRVPYNDDGESNLRNFKTDPSGVGSMSIYWHPENTSDRHWDGLPDGTSQVDGEFSTTDQWGNTMVGQKVGDYIEVTFGAPLYNSDTLATYRNTEVYVAADLADYVSAVMSNDITKIWKGTAADYAALAPNYDNNTFYIVL